MRDLASCYGDHAVKVADTACSGSGRGTSSQSAGAQSGVTCIYRSRLSSSRELLIRVTWTKNLVGQGLALAVEDLTASRPNASSPVLLRKKKGSRSFVSGGAAIGLYWDISRARYDSGPEPVDGFYVAVIADTEVALLVGDMSAEHACSPLMSLSKAEFRMIGRCEQVLGNTVYCTKTKFHESGRNHEISIRCKAADDVTDMKESELWVFIDKKKVVHVRRLRWNFRGNQTIFVDGVPIDMMWDVHDWWFSGHEGGDRARGRSSDRAVFMFRTRSTLESRLWLEEELLQCREQGKCGFSLLIHAFRIP